MILVTRLDRQSMFLNPDQIVSVEETPDTVITLFNGNHILVREASHVILNRIIAFRAMILRRAGAVPSRHAYLRRQRRRHFHRAASGHLMDQGHPSAQQPFHRQDI